MDKDFLDSTQYDLNFMMRSPLVTPDQIASGMASRFVEKCQSIAHLLADDASVDVMIFELPEVDAKPPHKQIQGPQHADFSLSACLPLSKALRILAMADSFAMLEGFEIVNLHLYPADYYRL